MGRKTQLKVAHHHYEKGLSHNEQGNWGLADEEFHRALFIFRSLTVWEQVVNCHKSIGNVCFNKKLWADALKNWQAAAEIAENQLGSKAEAGSIFLDIGDLHYEMNEQFAAGHAFEKALSLFSEMPQANELSIGVTHHKLGNVNFRMDRLDKAEEHFVLAQRTYEAHGKEKKVAAVLKSIGHIYMLRKDLVTAKRNFMRSFEIYSRVGRDDVKRELSMAIQDIENREQKKELQRRVRALEQGGSPREGFVPAEDDESVVGHTVSSDYPIYGPDLPSMSVLGYQPSVSAPRKRLEEQNTRLVYHQIAENKAKARLSPDVLLSRHVAEKKENLYRK